jgi:hypothetical protein
MHAFCRLTVARPCFLLVESAGGVSGYYMALLDRATFMRHSTPHCNVFINTHVSWLFTMARLCWLSGGDFSGNLRPRPWIRAVGGISGYQMAMFARPPLCAYQHCALPSPYNYVRVLSPYGQRLLRKYKAMPLCCYGESWLYAIQHTSSMNYGGMNVRRSFHRF